MNYIKNAIKVKLKMVNPYNTYQQYKTLNSQCNSFESQLIDKKQINYDTHILRLSLPIEGKCLGIRIGQYIDLHYKQQSRPYVPISRIDEPNCFDIMVRDTQKINGPQAFSSSIIKLKEKQIVRITGPQTNFIYNGKRVDIVGFGQFIIDKYPQYYRYIGIITFETGITKSYSLIESVYSNFDNHTALSLLWLAKKSQDFVFLEEFSHYHQQGKLSLNLMLTDFEKGWPGPYGEVTESDIEAYMPPPLDETLIIVAGNTLQRTKIKAKLHNMGYNNVI